MIQAEPTWHAGEVFAQEQVMGRRGASLHRDAMTANIRSHIPDEHADFYESSPWLVVSTLDADEYPRASLLQRAEAETPIFSMPDPSMASYSLSRASAMRGDAFLGNVDLEHESGRVPVGMLGIELSTRRRNRLNGFVKSTSAASSAASSAATSTVVSLSVAHSFGNCPKYIQSRDMRRKTSEEEAASSAAFAQLRESESSAGSFAQFRELLEGADTLFIASGTRQAGLDVSHRGGNGGFVSLDAAGEVLSFEDFVGNGFFNTIGNIVESPRVGLLCVDFASGRVLQVSGDASVSFGEAGASSTVSVRLRSATATDGGLRYTFSEKVRASPFNPPLSGEVGDAARLTAVRRETHDTRTFVFSVPRPLRYRAGQFATFRIEDAASGESHTRAWTLSSTPREGPFGETEVAITVKRKRGGKVSTLMHDDAALGALSFRITGVEGRFVLPELEDAAKLEHGGELVFAVAGSGVTPAMSILRRLAATPHPPRATVFYSVRSRRDVIFAAALQRQLPSAFRVFVNVTQPDADADADEASESGTIRWLRGRVSAAHVVEADLPEHGVHTLFVCGPAAFGDAITDHFKQANVHPQNTVLESFDF